MLVFGEQNLTTKTTTRIFHFTMNTLLFSPLFPVFILTQFSISLFWKSQENHKET